MKKLLQLKKWVAAHYLWFIRFDITISLLGVFATRPPSKMSTPLGKNASIFRGHGKIFLGSGLAEVTHHTLRTIHTFHQLGNHCEKILHFFHLCIGSVAPFRSLVVSWQAIKLIGS